jgi:hypothetical protein
MLLHGHLEVRLVAMWMTDVHRREGSGRWECQPSLSKHLATRHNCKQSASVALVRTDQSGGLPTNMRTVLRVVLLHAKWYRAGVHSKLYFHLLSSRTWIRLGGHAAVRCPSRPPPSASSSANSRRCLSMTLWR